MWRRIEKRKKRSEWRKNIWRRMEKRLKRFERTWERYRK
jgi:hypothetical protein